MKGNSQALPALCLAFCKKEYYPFCIPAFRFLPWGAGHPRRLMSIWTRSQDHPQAGPDSPDPLSSPKPPITCGARGSGCAWGEASGSFPPCPDAHGRPSPPLMTPCRRPSCWSRRGGGPAQPRLWFLFPLRQASGSGPPARCRLAQRDPHSPSPAPTADTMCSPFRASRSFQPEGELGMGDLPLTGGGVPLPHPPIAPALWGLRADPGGVAVGFEEPRPVQPSHGTWPSWPHPQPG